MPRRRAAAASPPPPPPRSPSPPRPKRAAAVKAASAIKSQATPRRTNAKSTNHIPKPRRPRPAALPQADWPELPAAEANVGQLNFKYKTPSGKEQIKLGNAPRKPESLSIICYGTQKRGNRYYVAFNKEFAAGKPTFSLDRALEVRDTMIETMDTKRSIIVVRDPDSPSSRKRYWVVMATHAGPLTKEKANAIVGAIMIRKRKNNEAL